MAIPSPQRARRHRAAQADIAAGAAVAIASLFRRRRPWGEILTRWADSQRRAATASIETYAEITGRDPVTTPSLFSGITSAGYAPLEPLVATIDKIVPAPEAVPLPEQWWELADVDLFLARVEQLVASEVHDAGNTAFGVELLTGPDWQNYVRVLQPPSCKRCVILAGRIYRDLDGFERHPECDCVHWPVDRWEEAHEAGLVSSPAEAFAKGQVRDLTRAETTAIADGADMAQVVNATRGTSQPGLTAALTVNAFGRRVKATTYGTTKRAEWRRRNPSRPIRLRPESIYRIAGDDRNEARRLLRLYGYIR